MTLYLSWQKEDEEECGLMPSLNLDGPPGEEGLFAVAAAMAGSVADSTNEINILFDRVCTPITGPATEAQGSALEAATGDDGAERGQDQVPEIAGEAFMVSPPESGTPVPSGTGQEEREHKQYGPAARI